MNGDNDSILICMKMPCDDNDNVPGFVCKCEFCKADVKVSFTGHGAAAEGARENGGRVIVSCFECSVQKARSQEFGGDVRFTDEQVRQVESVIGRKLSKDEVDDMLTRMRAFYRKETPPGADPN